MTLNFAKCTQSPSQSPSFIADSEITRAGYFNTKTTPFASLKADKFKKFANQLSTSSFLAPKP